MHLLVLSAFRRTAWRTRKTLLALRLNTPFGAQCFPTQSDLANGRMDIVSMHLLVLSAFRPELFPYVRAGSQSQCTFWCSVLSDRLSRRSTIRLKRSLNAPFGAQCFPTGMKPGTRSGLWVSMHLLVLSAFRPECGNFGV